MAKRTRVIPTPELNNDLINRGFALNTFDVTAPDSDESMVRFRTAIPTTRASRVVTTDDVDVKVVDVGIGYAEIESPPNRVFHLILHGIIEQRQRAAPEEEFLKISDSDFLKIGDDMKLRV